MQQPNQIIQILHLEDNALDAELIQDRLELDGMRCSIRLTMNRDEFASALASGSWDIVLCDYNIPGYDGSSALQLVRKHFPAIPVIMLSSSLSEEEAVKCLHMGASDYLLKQSLTRLPSAISRAMDQAKTALQKEQAEQRFRALLEFAPDAMVIVDSDGTIALLNSQAERLFGYERRELLGKPLSVLIPERFRASHRAHVDRYHAAPTHKSMRAGFELIALRKDGSEMAADISLSPLETLDGTLTISMIRDITERRKLEANQMRAQRMETIGGFAGNIAHDLNNALSPVLMSLELLRLQYPESSDLVEMIESGTRRGAEMLRQLLVFSKGSFVESKPVDPARLIEDLRMVLSKSFPSNINLRLKVDEDIPRVMGDSTQIHQVLMNLCLNARDAMPDGGVLTVAAECVDIDASYASIVPNASRGRHVVFRVSDSGSGIEPQVLDRIFEPFFSTKPQGKGTGLGLSIVVGIVKSHRGFINAYSSPGAGSTFAVYIPTSVSDESDSIDPIAVESSLRGDGETVLVVDDVAGILGAAGSVLEALNFRPVLASDGISGLDRVDEIGSDLAVVITDIHMPGMDGRNFVAKLRERRPDVGIIVMSGNLEEEIVDEFKSMGVTTFLGKPFTQDKLTAALRSAIVK
ncbi:MAG: response regulator [Fimbriimonas sp.]|nr:response regulator [Fimbriimonas sp.]